MLQMISGDSDVVDKLDEDSQQYFEEGIQAVKTQIKEQLDNPSSLKPIDDLFTAAKQNPPEKTAADLLSQEKEDGYSNV